MTHPQNSTLLASLFGLINQHGTQAMTLAFQTLLNEAMKLERAEVLQAHPYQRTEQRLGYANGFKPKTLQTSAGALDLQVPKVRGDTPFYPSCLERGLRSERALKLAIAEMYLQGVSTRRVAKVMEQLCGFDVTSMQVSRATQLLDGILDQWRSRPLNDTPYPYLVLDARYEKVRIQGGVQSCAVLIAVGIDQEGKRAVLGTSVAFSEAEVHWRDFLESLQSRGLHGVQYTVSDNHAGLKAAIRARMPAVAWQRCQFHLQQNASKRVPRVEMRKPLASGIRDVFLAPDLDTATQRLQALAERYRQKLPALADWLEKNVPESLAVFTLPEEHRKRLRTSNSLENLNRQIRRRTRVANIFPNDASLLRLVSAILMEISEEWETGKCYVTFSGVLKDRS